MQQIYHVIDGNYQKYTLSMFGKILVLILHNNLEVQVNPCAVAEKNLSLLEATGTQRLANWTTVALIDYY